MAKVLVVDDHRNIRNSLRYSLSDAGYTVMEAQNGLLALEKVCQDRLDIILLDMDMPGMNGFQFLQRLRENPATDALPVVMLTGSLPEMGEHTAMKLGATHYVTKPWDPHLLELTIRVALREADKPEFPISTNPSLVQWGDESTC